MKTSCVGIRSDYKLHYMPQFRATAERLGILFRVNQEQKDYFYFVFEVPTHLLRVLFEEEKKSTLTFV